MAVLKSNIMSLKLIFKSQIRYLLISNGYKTASRPYNNKRYDKRSDEYMNESRYTGSRPFNNSYEKRSDGFVSESNWFKRLDRSLRSVAPLGGAKVMDQPVTVDCKDIEFKTWNKFSEIEDLDSRLLEVLVGVGHDEMTSIQKHTYDILNRQLMDILGSAETGSGKTLAFLIPILNKILSTYPTEMMEDLQKTNIQTPMMLVLAPTRELVQQIHQEARNLTQLTPLRVCDVIGGVNISTQMSKINNGCHSLIATPGRLIDLISRGVISLKHCKSVVLDEADRMLDMGFEPQIRQIMFQFDLPSNDARQTSMFSATFPADVMNLARKLLKNSYGKVLIGNNAGSSDPTIPESITQSFVMCDPTSIFVELFKILETSTKKTIVFCNTKREVEMIERFAHKRQMEAVSLYGDLSQRQRDQQLSAFKRNEARVLIATSVAARGIDVADVERVINYGAPTSGEEYVHRVGRCGRMGREGEAVTLVTARQLAVGTTARDLVALLTRTGQSVPAFLEGVRPGPAAVYGARRQQRPVSDRSRFFR